MLKAVRITIMEHNAKQVGMKHTYFIHGLKQNCILVSFKKGKMMSIRDHLYGRALNQAPDEMGVLCLAKEEMPKVHARQLLGSLPTKV